MKKRITLIIIIFLMAIFGLGVWPFCIVRKEAIYWTESSAYLESNFEQEKTAVMRQTFETEESYVSQIGFAISFSGDDCNAYFKMYNENGELLAEKSLKIPEEESDCFCYVSINKWVEKGRNYTFEIEVLNSAEVNPRFLYTQNGERTALGNQELYVNGEYYDGQAVTSYQYREPLNYKNILFIWAAILAIGLSFIRILYGRGESKKVQRLDECLEKYGCTFLLFEILVISVLLIRSCFTKVVDWDEAYTWDTVTRNSFWGVIEAQTLDCHPPLYYLIAKIATFIFGNKTIVFKAVSVSGSLASMFLSATAVRKRWGTKTATLLILIIGLGPQFVFFNINLRMYSWMVFFVFASAVVAYELVCGNDKKVCWILFVLSTLGALYTQYFSVVPLFIIYAYLLAACLIGKRLKQFVLCCMSVIVAYLPQMYQVVKMLQRDSGSVNEGVKASLNLAELCRWSFGTNIKWSEYVPAVLYITAFALLLFGWRKMTGKEKGFAVLSAVVYPITCLICYFISANMNHFWDNRYMLDALLFVWIFIAIIYSRQGTGVWLISCICVSITSLSAYGIVYSSKMNTTFYIEDAIEKLSVMQGENTIIYNYSTFDVLYRYYLPDAEFIWVEDVDFSELDADYIYMINWGGLSFSEEDIEKYDISMEHIDWVRLEQGVDHVELCKIHFKN